MHSSEGTDVPGAGCGIPRIPRALTGTFEEMRLNAVDWIGFGSAGNRADLRDCLTRISGNSWSDGSRIMRCEFRLALMW